MLSVEEKAYYWELWHRFGESHSMFHKEAVERFLEDWETKEQGIEARMVLNHLVRQYTIL